MWMMYAKRDRSIGGVRLKLPAFPFQEHILNEQAVKKALGEKMAPQLIIKGELPVYPPVDLFYKHLFVPMVQNQLLHKVEYTNDENKLNPKVFAEFRPSRNNQPTAEMDLAPLGKSKHLVWSFQNEWRYVFTVLPLTTAIQMGDPNGAAESERITFFQYAKNGIAALPFSHIDLPIAEGLFADIEITLSPTADDVARTVIEAVIKQYCPTAKIVPSALSGMIRS
jgi:hypothetical protein